MMRTTVDNLRDISNKSSNTLRRWNNQSTSSNNMDTPLVDRTNTQRSARTTTTAESSFLPELYSTPPMPSFQKPGMNTSASVRQQQNDENATPTRGGGYIPPKPRGAPHLTTEPSSLNLPRRRNVVKPISTVSLQDLIGPVGPLPSNWERKHDQAICILDVRNYSLPAIAAKMKTTFPELRGALTPAMIDKRFRILDQIPELNYWKVAQERTDAEKKDKRDKKRNDRSKGVESPQSSSTNVDGPSNVTDEASSAPPLSNAQEGRSPVTPTSGVRGAQTYVPRRAHH
ncbi:adenylate kinase [Lecanosticta acicola]|uniref:Adenylate kinase n=1 Tax=Lecanosticta acicola TaxID=111012 RepID=A0AAI8YTH7_9PEZI|nr:adenylate kinase [Lecanosticta acicola]